MDVTTRQLIGEFTFSMYKQACENADLLNDADMIEFKISAARPDCKFEIRL